MIGLKNINDYIYYHTNIFRNLGIRRTYSQMGEDLIVSYIFKNLNIENPTYIDIGASDPFALSNTALLYKNGSRGVNIEPDPTLIGKFKRWRKRDTNLNIGITDTDGEMILHIMSQSTLNTFSHAEALKLENKKLAKIKSTVKVPTRTINSVIKEYCGNEFPDFLSLDVEGYELPILKAIDWNNNYPKVICCETLDFCAGGRDTDLIDLIVKAGYSIAADTLINTIFLHNTLELK